MGIGWTSWTQLKVRSHRWNVREDALMAQRHLVWGSAPPPRDAALLVPLR